MKTTKPSGRSMSDPTQADRAATSTDALDAKWEALADQISGPVDEFVKAMDRLNALAADLERRVKALEVSSTKKYRSNANPFDEPWRSSTPMGQIDTSIKCPVCFVHGGAHDQDTHRRMANPAPVPPESPKPVERKLAPGWTLAPWATLACTAHPPNATATAKYAYSDEERMGKPATKIQKTASSAVEEWRALDPKARAVVLENLDVGAPGSDRYRWRLLATRVLEAATGKGDT